MQRYISSSNNNLTRQFFMNKNRTQFGDNKLIKPLLPSPTPTPPCDVFINHRGIDTKRTVVTLLYDHLLRLNLRPFLDNKTMKPGDKLFHKINDAIINCKLGICVFSPTYCESYFCLHELALFMETNKKVIPIFCDVKPSELKVMYKGKCSQDEVERFNRALEEAKHTVGLTFDSLKGNWSEVVKNTADIVTNSLMEIDYDNK
ncbi:hypothetical protein ACFE04_021960 [Oxalis oulophora]